MSERNPNFKRDTGDYEFEASSTSVSPLKKKKLDDSSTDSRDVVLAVSSSVASSAGKYDDQTSSICSGCFSNQSNEITRNSPTFVIDPEVHQNSETEISTSNIINFRNPVNEALEETKEMESSPATKRSDDRRKQREVRKTPTPEEIEEFFSELKNDDKQKRFIEKYNFDIVNDKPLEGRYKWYRLKP